MQDAILVMCRKPKQAALIARTLRWREVPGRPIPFGMPAEEVLSLSPRGLILAVDDAQDALEGFDFSLLTSGIPLLALGSAVSFLCSHFGGTAAQASGERTSVTLGLENSPLFEGIDPGERMLPAYAELTLPDVLTPIATVTERVIGFTHHALPLYAMQYPIERNDPDCAQMLANFATLICGAKPAWTDEAIIDRAVARIREAAPEGHVLCAVSGGVDSAVCAKLASMAVGDRLMCVFVDTGLFRQGEPDDVIHAYMDAMGLVVAHVEAADSFLNALSGVNNPADKERIASQLMTQVLIKQLQYDPEIRTIVLGTNYNDILLDPTSVDLKRESPVEGVGVCEPIRDLFKEEVRRLAEALALPASIAKRQPFPSSGLALRVMSAVSAQKLDLLRLADRIFCEEITAGGHDRRLWQYYATLIESPDNPGGYAVCLRATQAAAGTACAARMPFDVLERTTQRIRAEVAGVTRVVYDLTPSAHYGELE